MIPEFFLPRNNLGTVYNMMRDHEKAQEYFLAAQQVAGHDEPDKNDLWNMGIVRWQEMDWGSKSSISGTLRITSGYFFCWKYG